MIDLFSAEKVWIEASKSTDWSLDGERQEGVENIVIENLHSAIKLIVPNKN
jgi:diacylglycerol kinase family enzyme